MWRFGDLAIWRLRACSKIGYRCDVVRLMDSRTRRLEAENAACRHDVRGDSKRSKLASMLRIADFADLVIMRW
eukprot:1049770-Prorocentrum_minimum.AAC.1